MTHEMKYGEVALGVECALPAARLPASHGGRARRYISWLIAALSRRS
jgi:hypothetical protein